METALHIVNSHRFFTINFAFLFGVFLASLYEFSLYTSVFIVFLSGVVLLYAITFGSQFRISLISVSIILVSFALGAGYTTYRSKIPENTILTSQVGKTVTLTGIVVHDRDRDSYYEYRITVPDTDGFVLVKAERYPIYSYGDTVSFTGKLEKPKNFTGDDGREFDYVRYLQKDSVYFLLSFAKAELISSGGGNLVVRSLYSLKKSFIQNIETLIPEPGSSLLSGILLGSEDGLGKNLEEIFRRTGIIHIVVLSGYNISIVANSIIRASSFLSKKVALSLGAVGIILFSLMVGGAPSVLRASVMALLVLLAQSTRRKYVVSRSLLFVCILMVLWNPQVLVFNTSFQFSFLSTIAIIWISPLVSKRLSKIPEKFGIRDVVAGTLATQVFVLPLLLYTVGQVSVVSLIVNVLVLGTIPYIMFFGFLAGIFQFVFAGFGIVFGFITHILLLYVIYVAEFFSSFSFASLNVSHFGITFLFIFYVLYCFLYFKIQRRSTS